MCYNDCVCVSIDNIEKDVSSMRVPNNNNTTAYDSAILLYNKTSESKDDPEKLTVPKIRPASSEEAATYSYPKVITSKPANNTSGNRRSGSNSGLLQNSDGDILDLTRIRNFVNRFGWDKVPPDNLKVVESFRDQDNTLINEPVEQNTVDLMI